MRFYVPNDKKQYEEILFLKGDNGKNALLRMSDGYMQWKNEGDETWKNLFPLSDITGKNGMTAYESAINGGYEGTEEDFYTALSIIGDIGSVLDAINGEVI